MLKLLPDPSRTPEASMRKPPGRTLRRASVRDSVGLSVLVVEDNALYRAVVCERLGKLGLRSQVADNGRVAIEMTARTDYDAILMDCLIPEIDGLQATRQIRRAELSGHVVIIALTALSTPGDRQRCLSAGMDDYLTKPVGWAEFEETIRRWLPKEHLTRPPRDHRVDERSDRAADRILDRGTVAQLREMLTPEQRSHLLDVFDRQQEQCAGEIASAVLRSDRAEIRRLAHLLKGSCASLGARRLGDVCQELEQIARSAEAPVGAEQLRQLHLATAEASRSLRQTLI
jgi:CheY-like chemotaxis protein/HPt (histidine-containing phosphotransfer) domain-containing protein